MVTVRDAQQTVNLAQVGYAEFAVMVELNCLIATPV